MAKECSFDIYAKVDLPEVVNAIDQANREMKARYDFKGSKSDISLNQKDNEITLLADDEFKLEAVKDILGSKLMQFKVLVTFSNQQFSQNYLLNQ